MAPRATWVSNHPDPRELVTWARSHGVVEVFLSMGMDGTNEPGVPVRGVVDALHAHGVRVAALGGDAGWIDQPEKALAWAGSALAAAPFDGLHLDVEAWVRPDWDNRRAEVVTGYLAVVQSVVDAWPGGVEVDLAHWLHDVPTAGAVPLDVAVMHLADAVTVLSYRNRVTGPDSITAVGGPTLAHAAELGVPCRLAVETRFLGDDPVARKQTFYGLGPIALERALREVDDFGARLPTYTGVAVHDLAGWRAL